MRPCKLNAGHDHEYEATEPLRSIDFEKEEKGAMAECIHQKASLVREANSPLCCGRSYFFNGHGHWPIGPLRRHLRDPAPHAPLADRPLSARPAFRAGLPSPRFLWIRNAHFCRCFYRNTTRRHASARTHAPDPLIIYMPALTHLLRPLWTPITILQWHSTEYPP